MGFFDTDRWNEIWQTITRNRKRSIMTALGVFWGIFMLTVLLGAGMGLGRLFRAQLGDMSTNTVLLHSSLRRPRSPTRACPRDRGWRMDNDDVEAVRRAQGGAVRLRRLSGAANSTAATTSARATIR